MSRCCHTGLSTIRPPIFLERRWCYVSTAPMAPLLLSWKIDRLKASYHVPYLHSNGIDKTDPWLFKGINTCSLCTSVHRHNTLENQTTPWGTANINRKQETTTVLKEAKLRRRSMNCASRSQGSNTKRKDGRETAWATSSRPWSTRWRDEKMWENPQKRRRKTGARKASA